MVIVLSAKRKRDVITYCITYISLIVLHTEHYNIVIELRRRQKYVCIICVMYLNVLVCGTREQKTIVLPYLHYGVMTTMYSNTRKPAR